MDQQIIRRAQGVVNHHRAGQAAGLYRAGRFIYNNRQNIADMARYGYRLAQRAYNRFGGSSSSSSSSRASRATMFKPRYPPAGSGGGGYRRPFRQFRRRPVRRYKKRYSRKSKVRTLGRLAKTLYGVKKVKATNYWNSSASIGSQLVTSMEIGNYKPDSNFAASPSSVQSPYAQKVSDSSWTPSGSINQVIDNSTWLASTKRFLYPHKLKMVVQNASNSPINLRFYVCMWRRAEGTNTECTLANKYNNARTADISGTPCEGFGPFDLQSFTSQVKILKTWKKRLGAGESTTAKCVAPLYGPYLRQSVTDEPVTRYTRGILIIGEGIQVQDDTTTAHVDRGPCMVNISATGSLKYSTMVDGATSIVTNSYSSGAVTTAEIPVGNANAPMAYDT